MTTRRSALPFYIHLELSNEDEEDEALNRDEVLEIVSGSSGKPDKIAIYKLVDVRTIEKRRPRGHK
jgi:hypothetical protein